ncbi:hypothetical protein [Natronolimnobius baerhuensis]|uniref:Ig-like domain-containing protein n=1 Tax=Natronolimnobius baerhuensis TaxID=253108 RepID=A0A202E665_9EURY|nr:hypothetical protein [Natronolimnobius baerhuensis]OVE83747.1 hypothetical protein B2G88_15105 [Natronolimnobius baerhuensis]
MNRRKILAGIGSGVAVSLCGCLNRGTSSTREQAVEPKEYPEIPDPLSSETVVDFASDYMEVELHNSRLTDETTSLGLGCTSYLHRDTDEGFYVLANCEGSQTYDHDGDESSSQLAFFSSPIFITAQTVVTVDRDRSAVGRDPSDPAATAHEFQLVNFDETAHEVAVEISRREEPAPEAVYSETQSVDAETALTAEYDIDDPGVYEYTITLEDGTDTTDEWEYAPGDQPVAISMYVSPERTLEVAAISESLF